MTSPIDDPTTDGGKPMPFEPPVPTPQGGKPMPFEPPTTTTEVGGTTEAATS